MLLKDLDLVRYDPILERFNVMLPLLYELAQPLPPPTSLDYKVAKTLLLDIIYTAKLTLFIMNTTV